MPALQPYIIEPIWEHSSPPYYRKGRRIIHLAATVLGYPIG